MEYVTNSQTAKYTQHAQIHTILPALSTVSLQTTCKLPWAY